MPPREAVADPARTMRRRALLLAPMIGCLGLPSQAALPALNDTGIQFCGGATAGNQSPCMGDEPVGQDAHIGRDAMALAGKLTKTGGGGAAFDYSKISNSGNPLPIDASLGGGPDDWACTRDNVTGLIWEVKVDDPSHARHHAHTYTWRQPDSLDGRTGASGKAQTCRSTVMGMTCNTGNYVATLNAQQLCGAGDWRLPSLKELESLLDYGRASPAIDPDFFPNTPIASFWSASPFAYNGNHAWLVDFSNGFAGADYRFLDTRVRAVRSAP